MRLKVGFIAALICVWAAPAGAAMHWWQPLQQHDGMQHDRMAAKLFFLDDGQGAKVTVLHADLEHQQLTLDAQGKLALKPTGKSNYHALVASRKHGQVTETAIRYVHMHGKPTGHSPSELTSATKADLEIVPDPLPREHWRYMSGQPANFQLLFKGEPLPSHHVVIESSLGTVLNIKTDAMGILRAHVPDDFTVIKAGRTKNPPAEWRIMVEHNSNDQLYRTALTTSYHVNPNHWKILPWGLAAVAGGMLLGAALMLRHRKKKTAGQKTDKAKE